MSNENDVLELIARLEKATGPDRELDCLIAAAVDWNDDIGLGKSVRELVETFGSGWVAEQTASFHSVLKHIPKFTASIDAAMALFGESFPRGLHLYRNTTPDMGGKDWIVSFQAPTTRVAARSWPLALCAGYFRARSNPSKE